MTTLFIHVRPGVHYDTTAKKLVGAPLPKGGYTIAFRVDGSNLDIAVARCHHNDSYSRKIGRAIAGGRLNCGKADIFATVPEDGGLVAAVVDHVGIFLEAKEAFNHYLPNDE